MDDSIKTKIQNGVNTLADTVKQTLGTKGRLILFRKYKHFDDPIGFPHLTKDGVTVARQISSTDPVENMAIEVVREASQNTVDSSGDGTTTTCILAQSIINEGYNIIDENYSAWQFNKDANEAVSDIVERIRELSADVDGDVDILKKVATVSSNDPYIGDLIGDIITTIGFYGDMQLKKTQNKETDVLVVTGMKLHKGFFAPFFCSDMDTLDWIFNGVNILIYDDVIREYDKIAPYIQASIDVNSKPVPILIYCQDITDLALNRIKKLMEFNPRPLMFVEHDGFSDRREMLLEDVSILTGAEIIDSNSKVHHPAEVFGFAEEVSVDKTFTSIIEGKGNPQEIDDQVESITRTMNLSNPSKNEKRFFEKRIANLTGGIAVINIGGATKVEMNEEHARIEDAVLAVKSAISKGVSKGGAYTWTKVYNHLMNSTSMDPKVNKGYFVVLESLNSILDQLLENAGEKYKANDIRRAIIDQDKAYNLIDSKLYDVQDYDIYDSTSILLDAIFNAVTVSKSILAIERVINNGEVYV